MISFYTCFLTNSLQALEPKMETMMVPSADLFTPAQQDIALLLDPLYISFTGSKFFSKWKELRERRHRVREVHAIQVGYPSVRTRDCVEEWSVSDRVADARE